MGKQKTVTVPGWVPDWLTRSRAGDRKLSRGTAEASVLVVIGSLVAGVVFGTGLTRTAVDIGDGLTWFADEPTGEVIQVNPATGRPEARIDVGEPGEALGVAQYDGRLIVTNQATGALTSYDMSSILVSGQRRVTPGSGTEVLHQDQSVYLVDRQAASIGAMDPVSTDAVGRLWTSPTGIADAAVDGGGRIWVIDPEGMLTQLRWSPTDSEFVTVTQRTIEHSGDGSVLVPHAQGVTVFGPDSGIVVQSDLGEDSAAVVASAPRLSGELLTPVRSPAGLVPVSSPSTGTVVVISDGRVHEVDVAAIGCSSPGAPEVFGEQVYVPCPGDRKVVRLHADGTRAGDDIAVPEGGDPALIVDDGRLLINVPGAEQGVVVDAKGEVSSVTRYDDSLPKLTGETTRESQPETVQQVAETDSPQTATPTTPPTSPTKPARPGNQNSKNPNNQENNRGPNGPTNTPTNGPTDDGSEEPENPLSNLLPTQTPPTAAPLTKPYNVYATSLPSGEIQVSWSYGSGTVEAFTVEEVGGQSLVRVEPSIRKAVVALPPGQHRFTVTAHRTGVTSAVSGSTNQATSAGKPSAVTKVAGTVLGSESSPKATVTITWERADDNGSAITDYLVTATDAFGTHDLRVAPWTSTARYEVTCDDAYCDPGPVEVSVVAKNSVGTGQAATATLQYGGPKAPPLPKAGAQVASGFAHAWSDELNGSGTTTLELSPPDDWADFSGTCSWTHSGNVTGEVTESYPCDATSLTLSVENGMMTTGQDGSAAHSVVFTATGVGSKSVQSAAFTWTTQQAVVDTGQSAF
jgi:hypothetical protein